DGLSSPPPGSAAKGTARKATIDRSGCGGVVVIGEPTCAGFGTGTHDPTSAHSAAATESLAMGWILLEALVALLLAVFIVWFTMGGRRKPPPRLPTTNSSSGEDGPDKDRGDH